MPLKEESKRATSLLTGKVVRPVVRHRDRDLMIEFEDGSRFFRG